MRIVNCFSIPAFFLIPLLSMAQVSDGTHEGHGQGGMTPKAAESDSGLGADKIPQSREASGTSWAPDFTPMYAFHKNMGDWELMLHGNFFLQYISEGSRRGDDQIGSINWLMGMARRPLAGGVLNLRTMLSAEPWTVGKCGYPDLLATGEFCNGVPLHDRQHPHDFFMEIAASYETFVTRDVGVQVYGGPVAEPALGPVAFPHRLSAFPGPLAPITHHWLDATHISFGVVTAGLFGQSWKAEASLFNGREPDENRTDFDFAPLDSYSGRLTYLPSENWSLQVSAGKLEEAEPAHSPAEPRIDVSRYTASGTYHGPLSGGGFWASTLAFGRNEEAEHGTNAALLETSYNLKETHILSGRLEWVEKTGSDLALEQVSLDERRFSVVKAGIGYTFQFKPTFGLLPGIGAGGSVSFLPRDLEPLYGKKNPLGFVLFMSLRPSLMEMGTH